MKKIYLLLNSVLVLSFSSHAQLSVDTAIDPLTLNTFLSGFGMTISNLTVNCHPSSIGTFTSNGSNIGMTDGLALSSGRANDIPGPNDDGAKSSDLNSPGDTDLESISGNFTFDACVVEFDCVPAFNNLLFNFVFGSEEYLEFAGSSFNDVFAIFISGPGITGNENIALVPGTSTPVSINNVNDLNNSVYYVDNGDGGSPPQNTDPMVIQYDGFTTNLTGEILVQPNETYHMKFAVADASDHVFDSGVMIESNSVRSEPSVGISANYNTLGAAICWDPQNQDHVLIFKDQEDLRIEIYDQLGALVINEQVRTNGLYFLNSSQYASGLYVVRLGNNDQSTSLRFMVE